MSEGAQDGRPGRRRVEREFGVPVPGEILPPENWVEVPRVRWPAEGPLDWAALFGRAAPVVLDLGCGNGRFCLLSALLRPTHDHLGVDVLPLVVRYARRRARQRGFANVRFGVLEARRLLERFVPPASVAEIHVYHPQPYPDPAERGRRVMTRGFLSLAHRALVPGGLFFTQTDSRDYWEQMLAAIPEFFDFRPRDGPWPDSPRGRTRREIIALKRGLEVLRGSGTAREVPGDGRPVSP